MDQFQVFVQMIWDLVLEIQFWGILLLFGLYLALYSEWCDYRDDLKKFQMERGDKT